MTTVSSIRKQRHWDVILEYVRFSFQGPLDFVRFCNAAWVLLPSLNGSMINFDLLLLLILFWPLALQQPSMNLPDICCYPAALVSSRAAAATDVFVRKNDSLCLCALCLCSRHLKAQTCAGSRRSSLFICADLQPQQMQMQREKWPRLGQNCTLFFFFSSFVNIFISVAHRTSRELLS